MPHWPEVSIVMPVFNAMPFLPEAVRSIFAQTHRDWELVVVDDASTDGSWEYLQSIDDPRVRVVRNKRNMRQSYTQNRGIALARGKWIARMDADDISLTTRLARQLEALRSNPEIDVVGCGSFQTDRRLNTLTVHRPPVRHDQITRWVYINVPLTHGTMVGKADWLKRWRADRKIALAQDFELLFRAHLASTYGNVDEPLYVYRSGGVTAPLSRQIRTVCYKMLALLQNGFRKGFQHKMLLGMAFLLPRPMLYCIKALAGSGRGLLPSDGRPSLRYAVKAILAGRTAAAAGRPGPETRHDLRFLADELRKIRRTPVPTRKR